MAEVMKPAAGDQCSIRQIPADSKDRETFRRQYKEEKEYQNQIKEQRFARIREERRKRKEASGKSSGINIVIDGGN